MQQNEQQAEDQAQPGEQQGHQHHHGQHPPLKLFGIYEGASFLRRGVGELGVRSDELGGGVGADIIRPDQVRQRRAADSCPCFWTGGRIATSLRSSQ